MEKQIGNRESEEWRVRRALPCTVRTCARCLVASSRVEVSRGGFEGQVDLVAVAVGRERAAVRGGGMSNEEEGVASDEVKRVGAVPAVPGPAHARYNAGLLQVILENRQPTSLVGRRVSEGTVRA